ncbi:MAG: Uma2 family endonuclease [Saprospiraceae bacterium]|nr:Uma2 family endonuclease [Saprospiraceae bacterium]
MNQGLVEKILRLPDAPQLVGQLNKRLQEEHERRLAFYNWIDEYTKAEFINGEVVVHSPAKKKHLTVTKLLSRLISLYSDVKQLGETFHEKAMIALTRNDYEPDVVFFSAEKAAAFEPDQVLFPAPDFVVEVLSAKTEKTDRTIKKDDYAAHGIREYWIVDPNRQTIKQYLLLQPTDKTYFEPYLYRRVEEITSRVIPGFSIPVAAVFDEAENVAALQRLMAG